MTFLEIRNEVRRRLRESEVDPRFFSDVDIDVSINEGYEELGDATEWHEKSRVIDILEKQHYYDMRSVIGPQFLVAGAAYNNTTSRWMTPIRRYDLDIRDLRWEQRRTEPEFYMFRSLWWLGYWPIKDVELGSIKQYYVSVPPRMVENGDEPGFQSSFHYALVEYALFDLFAQVPNPDLAWSHWKTYLEYEEKVRLHRDRRAGPPLHHGWASER